MISAVLGLSVYCSQSALALQWPPELSEQPFRCVYEGIFPQSTLQGTWEYVGENESVSQYRVQLSDKEMITPLIRARVADKNATIETLEMSQGAKVLGNSLRERTSVKATIVGPTVGNVLLKITSTNEQICSKKSVEAVGDRWTCSHTTTDGWTVHDGDKLADSGEDKRRLDASYHYLRDESVTIGVLPDVSAALDTAKPITIESVVVEEKTAEGDSQRVYLDPAFVWCPLRVERIRWNRVVGTDRLVARFVGSSGAEIPVVLSTNESLKPTPSKETEPVSTEGWSYWWFGLLLVPLAGGMWFLRRS